jgi:hypothetical protein
MTSYTVFADDCDAHPPCSGLTLEQAFAWMLDRCRYDHVFEQRPGGHALIVWDRDFKTFAPQEVTTTFVNTADARTVLMLKAVDGRFQNNRALPDDSFREQMRALLAAVAREHESVRVS